MPLCPMLITLHLSRWNLRSQVVSPIYQIIYISICSIYLSWWWWWFDFSKDFGDIGKHIYIYVTLSTMSGRSLIYILQTVLAGGGGWGALDRSGFLRGSAAPGSETLPYFRESRTIKTYGNLTIPGTQSGSDSKNIPYFRENAHNPRHLKQSRLQNNCLL